MASLKQIKLTSFQKTILVLSVAMLSVGVMRHILPPLKLSFAANNVPVAQVSAIASPTFLNIPKLSVGLPIYDIDANDGKWNMNHSYVTHPTSSAYPAEKGNVILFANDSKEGLGTLPALEKGDEIIVVTRDGIGHEYTVDQTMYVLASDPVITEKTPLETLTLFTSTGFLHTKRFVVKAIPVLL